MKTLSKSHVKPGQYLLGRYYIEKLLGSGGMGQVFLCHDMVREGKYALKVIHPHLAPIEGIRRRFLQELKVTERLTHPGIVRTYNLEHNRSSGLLFFTMEYVEGRTVEVILQEAKITRTVPPFAIPDTLNLLAELCDILGYAHAQGVIHRDIKPPNIMISKQGRIKLMDFGIAKILSDSGDVKHTGFQGSVYYMAPEQLEGGESVTPSADVFSLGVLAYQLLTGELPLGAAAPPSYYNRQLSGVVDSVVMRALLPKAHMRYPTIMSFWSALHHALLPLLTPTFAPAYTPPPHASSSNYPALSPFENASHISPSGINNALEHNQTDIEIRTAPVEKRPEVYSPEKVRASILSHYRSDSHPAYKGSGAMPAYTEHEENNDVTEMEVPIAENPAFNSYQFQQSSQSDPNRESWLVEGDFPAPEVRHPSSILPLEHYIPESKRDSFFSKEPPKEPHCTISSRKKQQSPTVPAASIPASDDLVRSSSDAYINPLASGTSSSKRAEKETTRELGRATQAKKDSSDVLDSVSEKKSPMLEPPEEPSVAESVGEITDLSHNKEKKPVFEEEEGIGTSYLEDDFVLALPKSPEGVEEKIFYSRTDKPLLSFVKVPAGEFFMGTASGDQYHEDNELPQRKVSLDAYWISRTPITNRVWYIFLDESHYESTEVGYLRHWQDDCPEREDLELPVVNISFHDLKHFCAYYGLQVPSEAQWERAARGENRNIWPWGDTPPTKEFANFIDSDESGICVVASHPKGMSPYGLLGCSGNVWEWCVDHWEPNLLSMLDSNPHNPVFKQNILESSAQPYTIRGGFFSSDANSIRCAFRHYSSALSPQIGARVIMPDR